MIEVPLVIQFARTKLGGKLHVSAPFDIPAFTDASGRCPFGDLYRSYPLRFAQPAKKSFKLRRSSGIPTDCRSLFHVIAIDRHEIRTVQVGIQGSDPLELSFYTSFLLRYTGRNASAEIRRERQRNQAFSAKNSVSVKELRVAVRIAVIEMPRGVFARHLQQQAIVNKHVIEASIAKRRIAKRLGH